MSLQNEIKYTHLNQLLSYYAKQFITEAQLSVDLNGSKCIQNHLSKKQDLNLLIKGQTTTKMAYLHVLTNKAPRSDYSFHEFRNGSINTFTPTIMYFW